MTKQTKTMHWNGLTLDISLEQDNVTSRIAGEKHVALKVVSHEERKFLLNDSYPAALVIAAGGAMNFIDVILSAQLAA